MAEFITAVDADQIAGSTKIRYRLSDSTLPGIRSQTSICNKGLSEDFMSKYAPEENITVKDCSSDSFAAKIYKKT